MATHRVQRIPTPNRGDGGHGSASMDHIHQHDARAAHDQATGHRKSVPFGTEDHCGSGCRDGGGGDVEGEP